MNESLFQITALGMLQNILMLKYILSKFKIRVLKEKTQVWRLGLGKSCINSGLCTSEYMQSFIFLQQELAGDCICLI